MSTFPSFFNDNQSAFLTYYKNLLPKSSSVFTENPPANISRCQEKQISARVAHKREMMPKKKLVLSNENKQRRIPCIISNTKRCSSTTTTSSSSYRQRLERIKTNCQLIRQRRRRLFPILPIELRPNLFEQRCHQSDALKRLDIDPQKWQSTNFLRLSDEYLYKCKFAMFCSTKENFHQNEFVEFLRKLFSYEKSDRNGSVKCHLCEEIFHSQDIFHIHMNRRSISIQYRCLTCQLWVKTMNPCAAYYHLLTHKNSIDQQIEQLTINVDWDQSSQFIDETLNC